MLVSLKQIQVVDTLLTPEMKNSRILCSTRED